jgi:hypothetical protein
VSTNLAFASNIAGSYRKLAGADSPPDFEKHEDSTGQCAREDGSS